MTAISKTARFFYSLWKLKKPNNDPLSSAHQDACNEVIACSQDSALKASVQHLKKHSDQERAAEGLLGTLLTPEHHLLAELLQQHITELRAQLRQRIQDGELASEDEHTPLAKESDSFRP